MQKIGVLTYHRADNFGAVMQAFSLVQYLKECDYEVEIIDYRCKAIERNYEIFNPGILLSRKNIILSIKEYLARFRNIQDRIVKKRKFEIFRKKYLPMSKPIFAIHSPLDYDVIITGSDQVWNFYLNKGSESIYLLDFPCNTHTQRVSYAASSERNGLRNISRNRLKSTLDKFYRISVRENSLYEDLKFYTDRKIEKCVDPTFLLKKEHLWRIAKRPNMEKFILVFHMTPMDELMPMISRIAREKNAEIIEVYGGFQVKSDSRHLSNWGPQELLGLICYAESVFTTSYHGLALSIIMEKDVWVLNKGDNTRQVNLLQQAGMVNRLLRDATDYKDCEIDYIAVSGKISPLISQSKRFLMFE